MNHTISSANLMAAMYFMGLSAQYSVEKEVEQDADIGISSTTVSPEQIAESPKHFESEETSLSD